jgi:hypothetical protein
MTFTYTGAIDTDLEKVRLAIGDTDSTNVLFTDAEINGALALYGSPLECAAAMAEAQAAVYSRKASVSIDGASINYGQLAKNFLDLAQRLRGQATQSESGGIGTPVTEGTSITDMDDVDDDSDRVPSRFKVGMMDQPGTVLPTDGQIVVEDDN